MHFHYTAADRIEIRGSSYISGPLAEASLPALIRQLFAGDVRVHRVAIVRDCDGRRDCGEIWDKPRPTETPPTHERKRDTMSTTETKPAVPQPEAEDLWGIVEIMGHNQFAGRISQDASLGPNLLRVDVPAVGDRQAFTKLFGAGSIYAITLCTEKAARAAAGEFQARPVHLFDYQPVRQLPPYERDDDELDEDLDDECPV